MDSPKVYTLKFATADVEFRQVLRSIDLTSAVLFLDKLSEVAITMKTTSPSIIATLSVDSQLPTITGWQMVTEYKNADIEYFLPRGKKATAYYFKSDS